MLGRRLGGCRWAVLTAVVAIGCAPVAQEEILGKNARPARVSLETLPPPPSAHSDIVPEIDDEWAKQDLASARFDNMAFRADGAGNRFRTFVSQLLTNRGFALETESLSAAEANAGASGEWWDDDLFQPMGMSEDVLPLDLGQLVANAVADSHQVKAFGVLPAIRQTAVREAEGRFTPEAFAEGQVRRFNDPATSPALTAGEDRLIDDGGLLEVGVRSRVRTGAEFTIAQQFGYTDTNSTDFIPGEQASSRSTVTLIQPLLRGSGITFNNAPTEVARLDTKIAQYELVRQVENHLLELERAYWNLYAARANLFLSSHLADHGRMLASQTRARSDVDADTTLVIRADAARKRWEADVARAESAVRNAQFRLAALTDSPDLKASRAEFLITTPPTSVSPRIGRDQILTEVLERRPELQQAFLQYEAAAMREGIAANEQLPELDLVLEGVLSGNDEGHRYGGALADSGAGALVGVRFSIPLGYDERDARYERRRLETVQQRHQTRAAISTVLLEVEVSASEYAVAAEDLTEQRRAREAAQRELSALRTKWAEGTTSGTLAQVLNDLIDAHEAANVSEKQVARARATLAVAAANFNRARGISLDRWGLGINPTTGVRGETIYRLNALLKE